VPGGSTADNVQLVQCTCTPGKTGPNERFYFPPTMSPDPVARPFTTGQPVAALQAGMAPNGQNVAPVHFSWLDCMHRLHVLTDFSFDPAGNTAAKSVTQFVSEGAPGFTGPTSMGALADGRVQVAAHDAATGDTFITDEGTRAEGDFPLGDDIGGTSAGSPALDRGSLVDAPELSVFTIAYGSLWYAPETARDLRSWRNLGGSNLVGTPVTAQTNVGTAVFALDAFGQIESAELDSGRTLSSWVSLGGNALTGTPAVVAAGGNLYYASETAANSGVIGSWQKVSDPADGPDSISASDPTLFKYRALSGLTFGIAYTTAAQNVDGPSYYAFTPGTAFPATPSAQATAESPTRHQAIAPSRAR
jgi:hypothetical protein